MRAEKMQPSLPAELNDLETQLETPVVPGELRGWLEVAQQTFAALLPALQSYIADRHRSVIELIADQDPGLLTRVEHLKGEDQQIVAELERQLKIATSVSQHSDLWEPDEGRADQAVQKMVDEGLALVIRIRKQEAAINTWFGEAFERDRGVAD